MFISIKMFVCLYSLCDKVSAFQYFHSVESVQLKGSIAITYTHTYITYTFRSLSDKIAGQ